MPVQPTLFGRPVALRMPPRRFQILAVFLVLFITSLFAFGTPSPDSIPSLEQVKEAVKEGPHLPESLKDKIPDVLSPGAHKPGDQKNSTSTSIYGAIEWLADIDWRNPFSKKITLDENRALLPPLADRPKIFTYYEPKRGQSKEVTDAENKLILAWRRAWWAQGFKPVVLQFKDAAAHPQYEFVQRMKLEPEVELEINRWCAWGYNKGGILADWLALPMAKYDNPMLAFLRRNEYPALSRVESMHNGVFFGEDTAVNAAVKEAVNNELLRDIKANKEKIAKLASEDGGIVSNLLKTKIAVDKKANGIAFYTQKAIKNNYKTVNDKLTNTTQAEGLELLGNLINSHLHLTFQEIHPDGIAVVKPLPKHTTALTYEAIEIGRNLTQCPTSPMPKSCPPNREKCKPCDPNKPRPFKLVPTYKNDSNVYSIGSVPHPYTLASLHHIKDDIDAKFLHDEVERDMWLSALTKEVLGDGHSDLYRVLFFKNEVASLNKPSHSLWLTAERVTQKDIEWIFGFNLPRRASPNKEPSSPSEKSQLILFPRPGEPTGIEGEEKQEERWIRNEDERVKKAREAIVEHNKQKEKTKESTSNGVKEAEDWSMADFEAWRYARAFSARRTVERKVWEEEEKQYSGSEKKASGGNRWSD